MSVNRRYLYVREQPCTTAENVHSGGGGKHMAMKEVPIIRRVYTSGNPPREPQWTIYGDYATRDVVGFKFANEQWNKISNGLLLPEGSRAEIRVENFCLPNISEEFKSTQKKAP